MSNNTMDNNNNEHRLHSLESTAKTLASELRNIGAAWLKTEKNIEDKMDRLSDSIQSIREKIIAIEMDRAHDRNEAAKTGNQIEELAKAVSTLNDTILTMNGKTQGFSTALKIIWALVGSVTVATIVGLATTVIDLKAEVAVLHDRVVR